MAELNAYLSFDGKCKEAMEYYQKCLGGSLNIMKVSDSPMAAQTPPAMRDRVMHSVLTMPGVMIMGSDNFGQEKLSHGNTVSLCLVCKTKAEMDKVFAGLSEGGKITAPLKQEFFGWFGQLKDKYGFTWMFQFGEGKPK